MDAIILAGGKGTRMNAPIPKALVEIQGMTIISRQIRFLNRSKLISKIVVTAGFKGKELKAFLEENHADVVVSVEETPLGTGGAVKQAMQYITTEKVLVFNCDDFTNIDLQTLKDAKENTICVAHPRAIFGVVKEEEGYAVFEEKPLLDVWASAGWYCFNTKEIDSLLPEKGSIEYDVFPNMKLRVYKHTGYWGTTNSPKDQEEREEEKLPEELR